MNTSCSEFREGCEQHLGGQDVLPTWMELHACNCQAPDCRAAWEELRLLPQPIHRFADEEAGTLGGALFVLVQGNDPEILVLLEVLQPSGGDPPAWRYSLARVSSMQMKARLDGTEIWSAEGYWSQPRSVEDPYREMIEPRE